MRLIREFWPLWILFFILCCDVSGISGAELTLPAEVFAISDGDTFWAKIKTRITSTQGRIGGKKINHEVDFIVQIRMLDLNDPRNPRGCWARELDEEGGPEAKVNLVRMIKGKKGTLIIDLDRAYSTRGDRQDFANLSRLIHMSRFFGDFLVDGYQTTIGYRQIRAGFASPTKEQLIAKWKRKRAA